MRVSRAPTASRLEAGADPSSLKVTKWPAGPSVVEIGQRFALGDDHQVEPAVVVEVADGQATADARYLPGCAGARETSINRPPCSPSKS